MYSSKYGSQIPKTAKIVNKINHLSNNLLLDIRSDVLFVKIVVALCKVP